MTEYRLPSLGADMESATFVEWLVDPGDSVKKGQVVAQIETAKALMEIEIFEDGVIDEVLVQPGDVVAVGDTIAHYRPATSRVAVPAELAPPEPPAEPPPVVETAEQPPTALDQRHIHDDVRRLAERMNVDLASISGTGHGERVRVADVLAAARRMEAGARAAEEATPTATPSGRQAAEKPVRASPRARRLAEQQGRDLSTITPSGSHGEITGEDVERQAAGSAAWAAGESATSEIPAPEGGMPQPAEAGERRKVPSTDDADRARSRRLAMRRAIAELMARSKREIPHYYLTQLIDMTRALEWLDDANLVRPVANRLLPAVMLIKAVARAIDDVPEMNGFWIDDKFVPGEGAHLGIAISLREGGLVAPAIHHADRRSLDELMVAMRDLVTRTRKGVLQRPEMTDPTITITNLGDQGVDAVYGVIYPPQVALVGFGRVVERPWAEGRMVGSRRVLTVTLAADHRASDGHRGGLFLASIDRRLQEPETL